MNAIEALRSSVPLFVESGPSTNDAENHIAGTRFYDNLADTSGNLARYDGIAYSGCAVGLNEDSDENQYVDVDIVHQLGADTTQTATAVGAGWVDNGDGTYTGTTASSTIDGLSSVTSGTVQVEMTLSGVTAGDVNGYDADGTYTFEETLGASLSLVGTGFTGTVSLN